MHAPLNDQYRPEGEGELDRTAALVSRRHLVMGAAMVGAAAIAQLRLPRPAAARVSNKAFNGWVPDHVGAWRFVTSSGVVMPTPDELSDRLYDNLVTRVYQAPDKPVVMIAIAYNNMQDGVVQLHRPEVCYPAGGFTLTPTRSLDFSLGGRPVAASFFTAASPERTEQILYWTRVGKEFPASWSAQRLAVVKDNLLGHVPDGMLFRASVLSRDSETAVATLGAFIRDFVTASAPPLRKLLVG